MNIHCKNRFRNQRERCLKSRKWKESKLKTDIKTTRQADRQKKKIERLENAERRKQIEKEKG